MKKAPDTLLSPETDKDLSGDLLRSVTLGILGISLAFVLLTFFIARELMLRASLLGGGAILICFSVLRLISREKFRLAAGVLVAFLWLTFSLASYTAGGVEAPIFMGYTVAILVAALFLGSSIGLLVTLLTVFWGMFMIYSDVNGLLPTFLEYPPGARFFIYIFFFFALLFIQKAAAATTKKAVVRVRTNETQYRSFLENISTVTYINDLSPDALTTYVSPQVKKMLGYSHDEFLANPLLWTEIIYPEDREKVLTKNKHTSETGESFNIEYRLISKDNKIVWVRDDATLIFDENGRPAYWLGVWTDITQKKSQERTQVEAVDSLIKRTQQLQTASEVSHAAGSILDLNELLSKVAELICTQFNYYYVGIFLTDEKREFAVLRAATGDMGKQMMASQHALQIGNSSMIGWCVHNNDARIALDVGKDAVRFKNPLLPLTRSELALPLRARRDVIGAMTIQSEQAAAFTEADITALQTMADQVGNAIETARLFDERASLIHELEAKNAELERFSYTVSHDLKSPLVTIRGFLGYLKEDVGRGDASRIDNDLHRIVNATETMQNLLNDLLELSRVGRIVNPSENVNFGLVVQETLDLIMNPAELAKVKVDVQENMPMVHCDRIRIVEVVQNLLSNAVKFMGAQTNPHIQIGHAGSDESTGYPIFFIKDNGVGVEPKHHDRVFGLFNRLNPEIEGTGIGLAIVKRVIEVHGGRIWLESEGDNMGSAFYFTLPPAGN